MSETLTAPEKSRAPKITGIIDADTHPMFKNGLADLIPYMSETWQKRLGIGMSDDWAAGYATSSFHLPLDYLYINSAGGMRGDTARPGMPPATDPVFMAEHLLDTHGIDRCILLAGQLLGIGAMPDPLVAATIASAYNDWMTEKWLQVDKRWRGGIVVAPQDPELAAQEIDRVADRPGMTEVFMPLGTIAMGERHYHPIYEACQRHGLPLCVHPSGTEHVFATAPRMAAQPTFYLEWHTMLGQIHQSNVASMLCHGTFERFPELTIIVAEAGFMWAAEVMWKLDRDWKGLRDEVPWLKKPPSDYLFDHIRFTTQPFYEPHKKEQLHAVLDMVQAERTLIFSSDYPHWDFDDPQRALSAVPEELRRKILIDTPKQVFGDRLEL